MNLRASVKTLEQRIEKLQVKKDKVDFAARLKQAWQEDERRQAIRESCDRAAIKELEELEHSELLTSLRELLQEADWIEGMEQQPDSETVDKLEDALNAARIRSYSIDVAKALNKLLAEDLPESDYDTPLRERNRAAIQRLKDNRQVFMAMG